MSAFLSAMTLVINNALVFISYEKHFPKTIKKEVNIKYLELITNKNLDTSNKLSEHILRLVSQTFEKMIKQANLISIGKICLIKSVRSFKQEKDINHPRLPIDA